MHAVPLFDTAPRVCSSGNYFSSPFPSLKFIHIHLDLRVFVYLKTKYSSSLKNTKCIMIEKTVMTNVNLLRHTLRDKREFKGCHLCHWILRRQPEARLFTRTRSSVIKMRRCIRALLFTTFQICRIQRDAIGTHFWVVYDDMSRFLFSASDEGCMRVHMVMWSWF